MSEMVQVHRALGLTDEESDEIAKDLHDTIKSTTKITEALALLTKKYDARTLLIGMRMMQLMSLNHEVGEAKKANEELTQAMAGGRGPPGEEPEVPKGSRGNMGAFIEAFGQHPELN